MSSLRGRDKLSGQDSGRTNAVPLVQLGAGNVGLELMNYVEETRSSDRNLPGYRYVGIADSSGVLIDDDGFGEGKLNKIAEAKRVGESLADLEGESTVEPGKLSSLFRRLDRGTLVDVTGSSGIAEHYDAALSAGWQVALANKIPLTEMEPDRFHGMVKSGLRYEATVGAGLPVISTLRRLIAGGDEVKEIAAILSGSLSYILSELEAGKPLPEVVMNAKKNGYTEPNPVEDLVGNDVHRKAVILGRTIGRDVSLEDVEVEPLVPLEERKYEEEELRRYLERYDPEIQEKVSSAEESGKRGRYVARIREDGVKVGFEAVDKSSQLAGGPGTANVIEIKSENYQSPALVIQGPGAGTKVTASGVLADMNSTVNSKVR